MKTIIAIILSALMAIIPVMGETTVDEVPAEVYMIEGIVAQNDENGILVNTSDMGPVLVLVNEETLWEGTEALEIGDYVYVDYNGMMTRSLPGQINAMVIRSYRMDGVVVEVFAEENAMLINTNDHGDVYVHLPATEQEADAEMTETAPEAEAEEAAQPAAPVAGDSITVYFNGMMTMSLPGQINAGLVLVHTPVAA